MLAQGQIEPRFPFEHRLRMCELTEAPLTVVGTHAGMACAIERNAFHHHVDAYLIDATTTLLLGLHDSICPFHVLGE